MKKIGSNKKDNNRSSGFLIAGAIGLILALVGYGLLMIVQNKILGGYNKVDVFVYSQDYGKGTQTVQEMFSVMTVEAETVPEGVLRDLSTVDKNYLAVNVKKNEMCMIEDFRQHMEDTDRVMELTFTAGNMNGNLAGNLRASDYVDIYFIPTSMSEVYGNTIGTGQQFYLQMLVEKLSSILEGRNFGTDENNEPLMTDADYRSIEDLLAKVVELQRKGSENYDDFFLSSQSVVTELLEKFGELELLEEYKRILRSVGNLKPDYVRVFIEDAYTGDGIRINNLDDLSIATQFRIKLSKEEAMDFITREQYCSIWLVKNNSPYEDTVETETEKTVTE